MADINPAIPMSMNYGTSPFIQSADIRKSLAAADSVNLDTAIKIEKEKKHKSAQDIIRNHLKDDGTLDPIGAMKDLYSFSPEHADLFAKEYADHMDNELKGLQNQGHVGDYPAARKFMEDQRGGQQQAPVAPAAPAQPEATLEQEQATTATMAPPAPAPEAPNPFAGVQVPSSEQPVAPPQTLGQMVAPPQAPAVKDQQAPAPAGYAEKYLQYLLNPTREQYAVVEPMLDAKQGGAALAMYKAQNAPAGIDFTPGSGTFNALADGIKNGVPMKDLLGNFSARGDRAKAFAAYMSPEMAQATGVDVASQIRPTDYANLFNQSSSRTEGTLTPSIQEKKVDVQARSNTAKVLNTQLNTADRLLGSFDASLTKYGDYENVPSWMYRDFASDYAKLLQSTGALAEGSVDKVMQMTAKGKVIDAMNYMFGTTYTSASKPVLTLLHDRVKMLRDDLSQQYDNQLSGENDPLPIPEKKEPALPVLSPTEAAKLKPGTHFIGTDGKEHVRL